VRWEAIDESYGVRKWKEYINFSCRRAGHVKIWLSESG